jgi:hypothetical protein
MINLVLIRERRGEERREGVKRNFPPSPNFCLQEAMTLLNITVGDLGFRILRF